MPRAGVRAGVGPGSLLWGMESMAMGQRSHAALPQGTKSTWDLCCGRAASRERGQLLGDMAGGQKVGEQHVLIPDARDKSASWSTRRSELATGHCAPCCVCGAGRT